jgi:hypothetical protein
MSHSVIEFQTVPRLEGTDVVVSDRDGTAALRVKAFDADQVAQDWLAYFRPHWARVQARDPRT